MMMNADDETLKYDYNMNNVEIKMLRKAVENTNKVTAPGSITASYYKWILPSGNFSAYYTSRDMSVEEDINSGLIFSFPQSVHAGHLDNGPRTKQGVVSFTLYQNKLKAYDKCTEKISIFKY